MSRRDLSEGSVGGHLVHLTLPMVVGVLAVMSIGLADAYFIGQLGEIELAAISFIFPVTTALTSLGIGLSAGANASVSQLLGARKSREAQVEAAHAMTIGLTVGLVVAGLGLVSVPWLFALLQAQDEVMPAVTSYMRIWYAGFPLLTVMLVINAGIRAHGNTRLPSMIMVLNAAINIGLDPLLIHGLGPFPKLGVAGAATATLVAFGVSFVVSLWPVFGSFRIARVGDFFRGSYRRSVRRIAGVGVPAALANAINPAGLAGITAILARFGPATVAGFGAAGRIEAFVIVPLLGLSGSIGPIIGQNFGAGNRPRAARALALAATVCLGYGLVAAVAMAALAEPLAALFSDAPQVRRQTALYLKIVSWSFFAYGILVVTNAALNARSKPVASMLLSLGRIGVLYIPLAALGGRLFEQTGVYSGALAANLIAAVAALWVAWRFELFRWPRPLAPV